MQFLETSNFILCTIRNFVKFANTWLIRVYFEIVFNVCSGRGTCFTTLDNNMEYIITAKHLFRQQVKSGDNVKIKIRSMNISLSDY